jgi:hypothetical protein
VGGNGEAGRDFAPSSISRNTHAKIAPSIHGDLIIENPPHWQVFLTL